MGAFDDLIPTGAVPKQSPFADLIPQGVVRDAPAAPMQEPEPKAPKLGIVGSIKDAFTGEHRTEFPDAPEFLQAASKDVPLDVIQRSAITPDPKAQLDIIRAAVPDLQSKVDKFGNIMLRAPGMQEWAYLNKPGFSSRDVDEFGTQTLATLPFLGLAGAGRNIGTRIATGVGGLGAASVAQDVAAGAMGSEQGVDVGRAAVSAGLGGLTAPGVPSAIGRGIASAAESLPVVPTIRGMINPEREAARRVGMALERDRAAGVAQLTPEDEALAARTGQPLMTMDFGGDTTRGLARSAANTNPEARGILMRAIDQRYEGQSERVGDFLRQLVGRPLDDASGTREAVKSAGQREASPEYMTAYQVGWQGRWSPALDELKLAPPFQEAMRAADRTMQTKAASKTLVTNKVSPVTQRETLEYWDQVKRALDDRISKAVRNQAHEEARDLTLLQQRFVDVLDNLYPEYRKARGIAATYFNATNALDAGQKFASQNYDLASARRALGQMSPRDLELFREGFASRVLERLNKTPDRRSIISQVSGSKTARDKLEIALGPNKARELEAFMHIETLMDLPRYAMGNSTTTRQLMELGLIGGTGLVAGGFDPSDPTSWITAAALLGARRGQLRIDQKVVQRVAQMLVAQDPAVRQKAIQQVAHTQMLPALRSFVENTRILRNIGVQQGANALAGGQ